MGDWETGLAEHVAERSQSRIGYLRLRAMGAGDIATFAREFYANVDREGLIIDVRHAPREIQEEAFRKGLIPLYPSRVSCFIHLDSA